MTTQEAQSLLSAVREQRGYVPTLVVFMRQGFPDEPYVCGDCDLDLRCCRQCWHNGSGGRDRCVCNFFTPIASNNPEVLSHWRFQR